MLEQVTSWGRLGTREHVVVDPFFVTRRKLPYRNEVQFWASGWVVRMVTSA